MCHYKKAGLRTQDVSFPHILTTPGMVDKLYLTCHNNYMPILIVDSRQGGEFQLYWADRYRDFCASVYRRAYHSPKHGVFGSMYEGEFKQGHVRDYFRSLTTDGHRMFLILDAHGNIQGGAAGRLTDAVCELKAGYVRTDLQGQGIGNKLLQELKRFAGGRDLSLDVVWYAKAIEWYRRIGFRETGELVIYPWTDARLQIAFGIKMRLRTK